MRAPLLLLCCLWAQAVFADSWAAPTQKRYYSADSTYFVEIVPLYIPDKYYKWQAAKPSKKHKFAATDTTLVPCHATMFRVENRDTTKVWEEKLINRVAPVYALVSTGGSYLVTFDNWASLGYGMDVFAVYDRYGYLLKRYSLDDFSPFSLNTYRRSISSLWWSCGAKLTASYMVEICFQDDNKQRKQRHYNLETLQFTP